MAEKILCVDTRIVYGANCVWWDNISGAGRLPGGLPCCPHCKSVLFEMDESEWWKGVSRYDADHPGYAEFVKWYQGKCFRTIQDAAADYQKATGKAAPL